jgi:lipoprotein-releasing system permease protein
MKTPFSLFLALRYLRPKRTFLSIITLISILGVTLGITVLIIVISVMTGFDRELQRTVLGFEPHVEITSEEVIKGWRSLVKDAEHTPGVVAAAPFVQGPVIVEHEGYVNTPIVRGIDPALEEKIVPLKKLVKEGEFDLSGDSTVIGSELASSLGVGVGDKITIYATGNIRGIIDELKKEDASAQKKTLADLKNEIVLPADVTVTGIFTSGRYDYDANVLFVPLHLAQELYGLEDGVHGISICTTDPYQGADQVKAALNRHLRPPAVAETWMDRHRDRFDAVRLERTVMFFILLFISVVAAFCVMNTLITVTVMKTREIGIMKALGATVAQIVWVFLGQGMVVGIFGTVTGFGLGIALVQWRNEFRDFLSHILHRQVFPATVYEFSKIPAEIVPGDIALICAVAFVFCSLAALLPAWFAARLDPVTALRYE